MITCNFEFSLLFASSYLILCGMIIKSERNHFFFILPTQRVRHTSHSYCFSKVNSDSLMTVMRSFYEPLLAHELFYDYIVQLTFRSQKMPLTGLWDNSVIFYGIIMVYFWLGILSPHRMKVVRSDNEPVLVHETSHVYIVRLTFPSQNLPRKQLWDKPIIFYRILRVLFWQLIRSL